MTSPAAPVAVDIDKLYEAFVERYRAKRAAQGDPRVLTDNEVARILDDLGDDFIGSALAEVLQEMPEAAKLPPLELSQLVAEALADAIAEAAG
jgi:hypothetical protein